MKKETFLNFVREQKVKHAYTLGHIGNADQAPAWFDMPSKRTVSAKGEWQVHLTTTGNEHNCFKVMLCCTADGHKLRAFIIFKQ